MGYALVGQDIFDEFDKDNSDQLSAWAEKSDSRSRATNMAQTTLATDKLFDLLGYQNSEGIQLNHIPLIYLYIFYIMIIINTYTYIVSPIYIYIYIYCTIIIRHIKYITYWAGAAAAQSGSKLAFAPYEMVKSSVSVGYLVHVVKTMSCLLAMTGNGFYIPPIKMVMTGRWFMTLF